MVVTVYTGPAESTMVRWASWARPGVYARGQGAASAAAEHPGEGDGHRAQVVACLGRHRDGGAGPAVVHKGPAGCDGVGLACIVELHAQVAVIGEVAVYVHGADAVPRGHGAVVHQRALARRRLSGIRAVAVEQVAARALQGGPGVHGGVQALNSPLKAKTPPLTFRLMPAGPVMSSS